MRELILSKIEFHKNGSQNFSNEYRWKNAILNDIHASKIKFEDLSDEDLLKIFEKILYHSFRMI